MREVTGLTAFMACLVACVMYFDPQQAVQINANAPYQLMTTVLPLTLLITYVSFVMLQWKTEQFEPTPPNGEKAGEMSDVKEEKGEFSEETSSAFSTGILSEVDLRAKKKNAPEKK